VKKFTKSVLFLLLVSIFLGASLFVGCRNPFMPDAPVDAMIPTISVQPKDSTVLSDAKYTVSVSATVTDGGTLSYQWYEANDEKSEGDLIEGETKSSLQSTYLLPNNETEKIFYYYVVVTNTNNNATGTKTATVTSTRAKITITKSSSDKEDEKINAVTPNITTQPLLEQTVSSGENYTVSVSATVTDGGTISYQWYQLDTVDGEGSLINGATSATYTTSYTLQNETEKIFYYYVVVTNTNNNATGTKSATVTSTRAKVTVNNLINAKAPTITEQPKQAEVLNTKEFTVSVAATNDNKGTLSYKWYKTDTVDGEGSLIESANSASYTTSIILEDDETTKDFYFYVEITNTYNEATGNKIATVISDRAKITVVKINAQSPVIDIQPKSYDGKKPDTAIELSVDATSSDNGDLTYQWYKDNEVISGATSAKYQIPDAELEGTSYYYCKVTNTITDNGDGGIKVSSVNSDVVCIDIEEEAPKPDVNPEDQNGSYFPDSGIYSAVDLNGEEAGYGWDTQTWNLGANVNGGDVEFAVYSKNATRLMLEIYEEKWGVDASYYYLMEKGSDDVWRAKIAGIGDGTLYAFRAWGPNWTFDEDWTRGGSNEGFISDVDSKGNRFNPNKVLFDPYAKEISHDKSHPDVLGNYSGTIYATGEKNLIDGNPSREFDTGKYAPKAVVIDDSTSFGVKPQIPQEKAIIYEAHARGITKHSSSANLSSILSGIEGFENVVDIPAEYQGTYKGAGMLAPYLKALGVNTIELLPVHESDNDANPDNAPGGNYWAYMTYGYFAPDRRYSSDKSLGGPTKEFKEMVAAFHEAGMEVYLDVVFNHSGEGGLWYSKTKWVDGKEVSNPEFDNYQTVELTFMRGLDNSSWYCLPPAAKGSYWETTGCGNNLQCDNPIVGQMILDSLEYWIDEMGVDGYRFDLAPVVGREFDGTNWNYNPNAQLLKDIASLGASRNAEMIAEAWDIGAYGVGTFPAGWGEWNGRYRDAVRGYVGTGNRGSVNDFINGDYDNFNDQGGPHKSVNFIVAHDGFTLADLCSYQGAGNAQNSKLEWPFGPSDGGNGDYNTLGFGTSQSAKRQANRNYIAIQMMSRGVPMIVWGDEFSRTQNGNNNPYNIDSVATWSNYNMINTTSPHLVATGGAGTYHNNFGTFGNTESVNGNFMFMKYMLNLKANEPALNQPNYGVSYDFKKEDGKTQLTDSDSCVWIRINGSGVTGTDAEGNTVQGSDYLVFMNMYSSPVSFSVPKSNGEEWKLMVDTSSKNETNFNYWEVSDSSDVYSSSTYSVPAWSVVIMKNYGTPTTSTPVIEYEADAESKTMNVTINCSTDGATIYYKEGNGSYQVYNGSFEIDASSAKTITAYAEKEGYADSSTTSKTLFIDVYTIYCKPSFNGTPYIHVWKNGSDSLTTWPGASMIAMGDGWYEYEVVDVNQGYDRVIFNDGSSEEGKKTADLTFDKAKPYFKMTGSFTGGWVANKDVTPEVTILFTRPNDAWGYHVYAYFFDNSNKEYNGAFPGTKMTWNGYNDYGEGQFATTVPIGATKLIISGYNYEDNSCINKTVDITLTGVTGYYITNSNDPQGNTVGSW